MVYQYVGERGEGGCVCVRCVYEDGTCVSKVVCEGVLRRRRGDKPPKAMGNPCTPGVTG